MQNAGIAKVTRTAPRLPHPVFLFFDAEDIPARFAGCQPGEKKSVAAAQVEDKRCFARE
jgi:hypothetical protein